MTLRLASMALRILALSAGLVSPPCLAQEFETALFGHDVRIQKGADAMRTLTVDGRELVKDQHVSIDEVGLVAGVPVAIGKRDSGGNACDASYFIVSFPRGETPRVDGPLHSCLSSEYRMADDRIVVQVPPSSVVKGERWTWTPATGFSPPEPVAFTPSNKDGWNAVRSHVIDHPASLLGYADLAALVEAKVPARLRQALTTIAAGPGQVEYRGDILVASACQAHSCTDTALLIAADIATRRVFVALKDSDGGLSIDPPFAQWPSSASDRTAAFRRKFVH